MNSKDRITIEDKHDIERHILDIHTGRIQRMLSSDLVLGVLDEKERKYVAEQVALAHEAEHLIVDKDERDYAVNRLLLKGMLVVVLNRNRKDNPLVEMLLQKQENGIDMPDPNMDKELLEKLEREKR